MKIFLLLGSVAVAVFFATSHSKLHWPGCHLRLMPIRCAHSTASNAPAVRDVDRVIAAAYRNHLDDTLVHLYSTVNRAQTKGKGSAGWAFVIEGGVPGLAARVAELDDAARFRVATVEFTTETGRRFRGVVLRGLRLQSLTFRTFARDLVSNESTLDAFNRWSTRVNALRRWYLEQLRPVVASATAKERAAVVAAISRY